jgi:hypothetical protein
MLCLGAMAMSYPPQCGDVPIANWDWGVFPVLRSVEASR